MEKDRQHIIAQMLNRDLPRLNKAVTLSKKAQESASRIDELIHSSKTLEEINGAIRKELQALYGNAQKAAIELYRIGYYRPADENEEIKEIPEVKFKEENESIDTEDKVFVRINRHGIFVRTPLLWTKNGRMNRSQNGAYNGPETYLFFKSEVMEGIKAQMKNSGFMPGNFQSKYLFFLYVYPTAMKMAPPDNDNHETKYLIDAMTISTPGGDSALCTTIIYSASQSDRIPAGCYVSLTAAQNGLPAADSIVAFWKAAFDPIISAEA